MQINLTKDKSIMNDKIGNLKLHVNDIPGEKKFNSECQRENFDNTGITTNRGQEQMKFVLGPLI